MTPSNLRPALIAGISLFALTSATLSAPAWAAEAPAAADTTGSTVEQVVVTAPRQEVIARKRQENAFTILNVQSAETIANYPDYNAAEALGRMPGVSLSTDTAEGRFVNIRGIDANLNGATYGGVVLLNTLPSGTAASGAGRAVEFDTIPTGAIDGIVLYKTLSPDREAEGLGGQIELTPRSSKDIAKPFVEGELGWGYENLHDHTGPFTAAVAAGARFGFNNGKLVVQGDGQDVPAGSGWISNPTPFSFVITGSRKDDRRGIDDLEPSYVAPGQFDRVDFRRYDYNRRRFGYGGNFDFKPNDNHSYYVRLDVAGYKERAHKNHWYAAFDGAATAPDAKGFRTDGFQPQVDLVDLEETHRNTVIAAGGSDRFNDLVIDYRVAYSRATYVENFYNEARYRGQDIFIGKYNTSNPHQPVFQLFMPDGVTPFVSTNVANYNSTTKTSLSNFFESAVDEETSYALNARYPVHLIGENGELKAGISARLRNKDVYNFGGTAKVTSPLSAVSQSVAPGSNYFDGAYPVAPYADIYAVRALVRANTTLSPSLGRDFNDSENVYAAYGMYTFNIGKLSVLGGLRVEQTDATYGNYLTTTDALGNNTVSFVKHSKSYTDLFPTIQAKYEIQPDLQVRATWSTGIARPGFTQAGGNAGVDFTASPRPVYSAGNPDLKPTTGNNFDLDIEYYMPNGGILQFGLFDKEFENYIFAHTITNVANPVFGAGTKGDFVTYSNESACARGMEVAYHQKFTFLPGLARGFGLDANMTVVDSRFLEYDTTISATGKNQYGSLPGTSHLTYNVALFYELNGLNLRLSSEHVGASLFGAGGSDKSGDTIQASKTNYDFTSSYEFDKHWTVYFNVKNLADTPLRYNVGGATIQREIYGQTFEGGVRARF